VGLETFHLAHTMQLCYVCYRSLLLLISVTGLQVHFTVLSSVACIV